MSVKTPTLKPASIVAARSNEVSPPEPRGDVGDVDEVPQSRSIEQGEHLAGCQFFRRVGRAGGGDHRRRQRARVLGQVDQHLPTVRYRDDDPPERW